MKQIFKRNQIIITALALMLCTAGYLQFSSRAGDDTPDSTATGGENLYFDVDGTSEDDLAINNNETNEMLDISDADILAMQNENEAAATATENTDDTSSIGEAILVSTTIGSNFSTNAKIVREQRRAQSKETLMAIINNELLTDEQRQIAVESLDKLTMIAEKENAAEILLEAKGFHDPIVNIVENEVDVVINASSVTDQQIAQIEDIVTRKTGFEPNNIKITAAIQEE